MMTYNIADSKFDWVLQTSEWTASMVDESYLSKPTILVMQGLPGSGKSTWYQKLDASVVSRDLIRANLNWTEKDFGGKKEREVTKIHRDRLKLLLHAKDPLIIVDDTNLDGNRLIQLVNFIRQLGKHYQLILVRANVPIDTCIKRDAKRTGIKRVGGDVIRGMFYRHMVPDIPFVTDDMPSDCIICDLDGTLALLNGRDPYDGTRCDEDLVNPGVAYVVKSIQAANDNCKLFFFSGRSDAYMEPTIRFLQKAGMENYTLHMRKAGDMRSDRIVKKEMYENYIQNKFNVRLVIDDRPQVVRVWHSLGLPVLMAGFGLEF